MQRRRLGTSGFEISTIGIGTWATGGWMWGGQDDDASIAGHPCGRGPRRQLDRHGADLRLRPFGSRRRPRPEASCPRRAGRSSSRSSASATNSEAPPCNRRRGPQVLAECDASLQRLGVDAIDLYQLHWPVAAADRRDGGRLRRAAEGRQDPRDRRLELLGRAARGMARHRRAAALGAVAVQHPAAGRRRRRAALLRDQTDIGVIAYSPLFRGLLFGTWKKGKTFPEGDARGAHKDYQGARFDRHLDAVAAAARARRRRAA